MAKRLAPVSQDPTEVDSSHQDLAEGFPPLPEDGRILFYSRDRPEFGFLSHFHPSPIVIDGTDWPTVEHFYQSQKSLDPRYRAAIRACDTANAVKRLASIPAPGSADRGSWFVAHRKQPRPDWADVRLDLMRRADTAKYTQNPDLARRLLATGAAEIVEDAKHDSFWGAGRDGSGQNWTGRILMDVREALRVRSGGHS